MEIRERERERVAGREGEKVQREQDKNNKRTGNEKIGNEKMRKEKE